MKTLEQLYNGFYLNEMCENTRISNGKTPLRVAPIKKVSDFENLEIDYENFAFAEKAEYFHGLKNFLRIKNPDFPPIFIFDNHNHAITFRYNIIYINKIQNVELIHIDQHSDNRENENHLKLNRNENELEKVFNFCNEKCNVGNFIPPSLDSGIISDQVQIRSITALKNLEIKKNQNFILDIDLDFCLDGIDKTKINTESVKILKEKFTQFGKDAICTTIATSPYFLSQKIAIDILEKILSK